MPRVIHESAFKLAEKLNRKPWVCRVCGSGLGPDNDCECGNVGAVRDGARRREIFSLSLGDWLDPEVPVADLARMLDTVRRCDQVRWLLLSKWVELFRQRLGSVASLWRDAARSKQFGVWDSAAIAFAWLERWFAGEPPPHVALGASVEDQWRADQRVMALCNTPAVRRFLSMEPLLGPVRLDSVFGHERMDDWIDWVVVGGESGPKARPCDAAWIRHIVSECRYARVPVFVKQLGTKTNYVVRDRKGADPSEWPEYLRIQERMVWP
jgi:hypothetical protein